MPPLSDGYKPPRLLVPIGAIGAALDRGKAHLFQETNPVRRRELEQLLYHASRGSAKALDTLWALGPVDRNRYTPSSPSYLAREEAYQNQQRENAAALAVTRVRELYNSLAHGGPKAPQTIPFDLAKRHGLFTDTITSIQQEAEEKVRREQEALKEQELEEYKRNMTAMVASIKKSKEKARADHWQSFCHPVTYQQTTAGLKEIHQPLDFQHSGVKSVYSGFLKEYKRIYHNSRFMELLSPYFTASFAEPWASGFPYFRETSSGLLEVIRQERELTLSERRSKSFWKSRKEPRINPHFRHESDLGFPPKPRYDLDYLDEVEQFVRKYQEGALVVYALLMTLENPLRWRRFHLNGSLLDRLNMMHLPTLVNREPFEVFLLLAKLDELLPDYKHEFTRRISNWEEDIDRYYHFEFNEAQLSVLLSQSNDERVRQGWWRNSEKPVQIYLMGRAYHIALNGLSVANQTFPLPTLPGISSDEIANMVSFMVNLLQEEKERRETERWQKAFAEREKETQKEFDKRFGNKPVPVPVLLPPRVLSEDEIEVLKAICRKELGQGEK